jgi:thiamine phosphate synthase YjbQ (UPF0047 family)
MAMNTVESIRKGVQFLIVVLLLSLNIVDSLRFISHLNTKKISRNTFSIVKKPFLTNRYVALNPQKDVEVPLLSETAPTVQNPVFLTYYEEIQISTLKGIHFTDLTPYIRTAVSKSGITSGQVSIVSQHTTAAITINEMESRLVDDTRQFLLKLAPASYPYLHNDLHLRHGKETFILNLIYNMMIFFL